MPERCKTYIGNRTESETRVIAKLTESDSRLTAECAVQLSCLPYVCTIFDITHLFNSLGIFILIIINNNKLHCLTELDSRLAHFSAHDMLGYFWCKI